MKRLLVLPLLLLTACGGVGHASRGPVPGGAPARVVLLIGDGTGVSYWSAAKITSDEPLAIESFPVVGLVDTRSSNSRVTDSAAGATAFSAGIRTYNGAIAVEPDSTPVRSVLEVAESRGWATGLVATATITHATPAAFAAHVPSRKLHFEIARQLADAELEVMLGGGRRFFSPSTRPDGKDLIGQMARRAAYVDSADRLRALDLDTVSALVGLFADTDPGPAPVRSPTLAELTDAALRTLTRDRDGFFLMVEGSQIDWRGHDHAPLDEVAAEVRDLDAAIREALRFQRRHPNTLVIVTADHSTGGLALHGDGEGRLGAHYTTEGHTAELVPLFARGPGAEAFAGVLDNEQVGRLLLRIVREAAPNGVTGTITDAER